jgi:hypothetical protein
MEDPTEFKTKLSVILHNQLPQKGTGRLLICLYLTLKDITKQQGNTITLLSTRAQIIDQF